MTKSNVESEYRALATTICELMWIKQMLEELLFIPRTPMKLFCDSKAVIYINNNLMCHEHTKYIEIDCHLVRENIIVGIITPIHVNSKDHVAHILTKGVLRELFNQLSEQMGLCNAKVHNLRGSKKGLGVRTTTQILLFIYQRSYFCSSLSHPLRFLLFHMSP